ncbi:hypothetical protein X777_10454 [Ooceraea biroi]|uniref:Uncharacterized protein n=1 Tax=Ooceraea biroi TaxID=2015173 RepID=A0A026W5C9_OOCBI|nr:hypothetical protein X777_10454 [Ooceraea biroi]
MFGEVRTYRFSTGARASRVQRRICARPWQNLSTHAKSCPSKTFGHAISIIERCQNPREGFYHSLHAELSHVHEMLSACKTESRAALFILKNPIDPPLDPHF